MTPACNLVTRRATLKAIAATGLVSSLPAPLRAQAPARYAWVGTYTGAAGTASGGNGKGIYRFACGSDGALCRPELAAAAESPSWLIVHPSGHTLYAANEIASYHGSSGAVSAYAINPATGSLRLVNVVASGGAGPAYIAFDRTGRFVLVANYISGSIAVLPIRAGGALGEAVFTHVDTGAVGSAHATDSAPASFAESGHDAPHAHTIVPDPSNRFVLSTDLGQDRIYSWRFDAGSGRLMPNPAQPFVTLPSGDGPRHLAFHPNGRVLYSVQEEASNVAWFDYEPVTGRTTRRGMLSTLPPGYQGTSFASELLVSRDGRYVYAGNRLHNSIAVFAAGPSGALRHIQDCPSEGDYCAQFQMDPEGAFLYACNHRSDNITVFRVEHATGKLTFTGRFYGAGTPGCITFSA